MTVMHAPMIPLSRLDDIVAPINTDLSIQLILLSLSFKVTLTTLLKFPVILPQTTVLTANIHTLLSVGASVQVVRLVVVGQLPQFDARML